ncbi:MAG: lytic transglycosylase domain-containing protein [Acidobacteriota bacterium]|nr:lytic transglycosylase domain-containing protein [Pyrinomonadaceae bacterium]MDW8304602.1 lytic transglycosylase domain-containing protein [Acidobacteriota bacterium]
MKIICLILLLCGSVGAQIRERVFDNFDATITGVKIHLPPKPERKVPEKKSKKGLVKKTSISNTGSVQDSLALRDYLGGLTKTRMAVNKSLRGFTTGDPLIDSYIVESSLRYGIDPLLIYAQMHQESSFNRRAVSPKGARGLMQLMPATARRFGVTDIFDPKQNIEGGVKYMRWLLDTFNQDLSLALAGYNAGEGAVMKYGWQIPPYSETREYVRRILTRYRMIQDPSYRPKKIKRVSELEAARLSHQESKPLSIYEPSVIVVRLPDGRMRLVTQ